MNEHAITLKLRLSNGRNWAHEFSASSMEEFRDGCLEALIENGQRDNALYLHVWDNFNARSHCWRDATYGSGSGGAVFVIRPNGESDQYNHPQWAKHWNQCVRCHFACQNLRDFIDGVVWRIDPNKGKAID